MAPLVFLAKDFHSLCIPCSIVNVVKAQEGEFFLSAASTFEPAILLESPNPLPQIPMQHVDGVIYEAPFASFAH
jgi:hypothetical protein